jgi:biopolymer transport protein ExbD
MAFHAKAPPAVSDINVTPLVDVMLVLLIIFMVITPMLQKGISVDLAGSHNPRAMPNDDKEDAVEVAITRDGKVFLKTTEVLPADLTPKIKDLIAAQREKMVYVRSDARARYGDVAKTVDAVRAAGVDSLGLLTTQLDRKISSTSSDAP